jgi:iron complex outermembrane receptor protein
MPGARIRWIAAALAVPAAASAQTVPFPLDTLRVEAGARALGVLPQALRSVQVLDRAWIERTPAQSVHDLLAWALGVDVLARSAAQADVEIRGVSFEGVLVLVDGVRASDTQTGHFDLDLAVPLSRIERIEILRGPASAQYGSDAMGGVIHIVTRRDAAPALRVEGGSFDAFGAAASAGARGVVAGVEHLRSDGARAGTDHRITQANAGVETSLGAGRLRADFGFAARDFGAADFYAPFPSYEETRTATAAVGWSSMVGRVRLDPRIHARRHADDFILRREDPAFYRNRHTTWQYGGEVTARLPLGRSASLAAGLEAARDEVDSNSLGERHETRSAAFAELAVGATGRALAQLGARLDRHSGYGSIFVPSAAVALWPADGVRVRASLGRSFRAPGWTERFYRDPANVGSPDLLPERAWTAEVGAEIAASARFRLDIGGYVRSADQLIDWARPDEAGYQGPWQTRNVDEATFRGIEATLLASALGAHWSLGATALSFDADAARGFVSKYALRPLTQSLILGIETPLARTIAGGLRGRRARRPGEAAFTLIDARLSWRAGDLRIDLDGTNLFDESYLDVSVMPAPGRAFRIALLYSPSRQLR